MSLAPPRSANDFFNLFMQHEALPCIVWLMVQVSPEVQIFPKFGQESFSLDFLSEEKSISI